MRIISIDEKENTFSVDEQALSSVLDKVGPNERKSCRRACRVSPHDAPSTLRAQRVCARYAHVSGPSVVTRVCALGLPGAVQRHGAHVPQTRRLSRVPQVPDKKRVAILSVAGAFRTGTIRPWSSARLVSTAPLHRTPAVFFLASSS